MKEKKYRIRVENILTVILLLYPLRKVYIGLDLEDAGYALGNYRFFETMNEIWKLATYLSNVMGRLLMELPLGNTWIGMNFYTSILVGVVAAICYRFLLRRFPHKYLLFCGEIIAVSLCWGPTVVLYHYMGYVLMTFAIISIYKALFEEKESFLLIAGVLLGMSVLFRMPNITYMGFIIIVWFYCIYMGKEKILQKTGWCVLGYSMGLFPGLIWISMRYGWDAYPQMIGSLFGMTNTATDYKPTSMIKEIVSDYQIYSAWLIIILIYMMLGFGLFGLWKNRLNNCKKIIYVAGFFVLLRFFYGRGMYNFDYRAYFSMYKWLVVYLLLVNIVCIYLLCSAQICFEEKFWAVVLLLIIWITPLGSNNGLYPLISNLFLIAPISFCLLYRLCKMYRRSFVVHATTVFVVGCVCIQSVLFGVFFVFHDVAKNGEERVEVVVSGSSSTRGLYSTVDKVTELNLLGGYLLDNKLLQKEVVLYGNIPAISYIFDLKCAVYTTWPDLPSNSLQQLEEELLSEKVRCKEPLVIVSTDAAGKLKDEVEREEDSKLKVIYQFLKANEYTQTFASNSYCIYQKSNKDRMIDW